MVFNHQWNLPMEIMPSNFGIGSFFCPNKVQISPDALRMRCRRLCTKTSAGKFNVDPSLAKQYSEGGEGREALQMALLEAIAKNGVERSAYKRVKVGYICDFFKVWWHAKVYTIIPFDILGSVFTTQPMSSPNLPPERLRDKMSPHTGEIGEQRGGNVGALVNRRSASSW